MSHIPIIPKIKGQFVFPATFRAFVKTKLAARPISNKMLMNCNRFPNIGVVISIVKIPSK